MKTCFLTLTLILTLTLTLTCFAGDISWQLIGKSSDNRALMSIDKQSITVTQPDVVRVLVKKEPTEETIAELKKQFEQSVQKAENETGTKVDDPEEVFNIYVKNQARTVFYIFSCQDNTYWMRTGVPITLVFPVPPEGAEKNIKEIVCKKAESENRGVGESGKQTEEKTEKDSGEAGKVKTGDGQ